MKIRICGVPEPYQRAIGHIVGLFFEEPELSFIDLDGDGLPPSGESPEALGEPPSGLLLQAALVLSGQAAVSVRLTDQASKREFAAECSKKLSPEAPEEQRRKQIRLALSHGFLEVLETYSGLIQPWGILTGVRPTKLLHDTLRQTGDGSEAYRIMQEEYGVRDEKIKLMQRIIDRQFAAVPDLLRLRDQVSLYIGIPFCPTKCAYCTFPAYDIKGRQGSVGGFLAGLHDEMEQIGRWLKERGIGITTIYYGGGTPTSITADEMDRLYAHMHEVFPGMDQVRELTVEAGRPDTITPEKLRVLNRWSIDRISINPQSYIQSTLDTIGRHHTVEETIEKFWLAREMGMTNINMDLIIGLPGEGMAEFEHTLRETEKLMPESLTVHTLSFKRASEMTQNRASGKFQVAGRDEVTAMMNRASAWTDQHGYDPYYLYRQKNILGNLENVGYAKPGQESIYNIVIMEELQTIIGLGCGAVSKWVHPVTGEISRLANPKEPKAYNDTYAQYTAAKLETLEKLYAGTAV